MARTDGIVIARAAILFAVALLGCALPVEPVEEAPSAVVYRPGTDDALAEQGRLVFVRKFLPPSPGFHLPQLGIGYGLGGIDGDDRYNATSCAACHDHPVLGGEGDAAHRVTPEHPKFSVAHGAEPLPARALLQSRTAPDLRGTGYIDELTDAEIATGCGTDAALGIAGHPMLDGAGALTRFSRRGAARRLENFSIGALPHEMGVECAGCSPPEKLGLTREVSLADALALVYFVARLERPPQGPLDPEGASLFASIGCATCHRGELGTDVCAHELGAANAGDPGETLLPAGEWRTAALMGVGEHQQLMHGRAHSVEAAVALHGGTAAKVRAAFNALLPGKRANVVAYAGAL